MPPDDFPTNGYLRDYLIFWAVWLAVVGGAVLYFRRTRGRKDRRRLVVGNALVFASLFWTFVVAGETWFRYVYDQTDQYGLTLTNFNWFRRHVWHNAAGFRDAEWTGAKRPGVERVVCLGDSFTEGWGVPDVADCWPQRVGASLEARSPGRFEVLNMAVSGWNTSHESRALDEMLPGSGIDRVIVGYCLNDVDDLLPPSRWFDRSSIRPVPVLPRTFSFLADFLWFRLSISRDQRVRDYAGSEKEAYDDPEIWERQRAQFAHMAAVCRAASVRLQVVVFPFFQAWGDGYPFDSCHDRVAEAWRRLGADVIDLREDCRGVPGAELVANRFDAHPNPRAHAIAAKAVLERGFGVK